MISGDAIWKTNRPRSRAPAGHCDFCLFFSAVMFVFFLFFFFFYFLVSFSVAALRCFAAGPWNPCIPAAAAFASASKISARAVR